MLTSQHIRGLGEAHTATHPNDYFYCLVDHAGMPGLFRQLVKTKTAWASLFDGSKQENALSVAPLLFQVDPDLNNLSHAGLLRWVGQHGTYSSSLMFLASPLPLQELRARLTKRLDVMLSENMEGLLRFYDPRVFEQLIQVLAPSQKHSFLSVATAWWYLDRRGELRTLSADFSSDDILTSPLQLSATQEMALVDASEPDQVAEQLRDCVLDEFVALPLPERYDFITRQMNVAREFHIRPTHELTLYCALALRHGERFSSASDWAPIFEEIRAGKINLTDAVATAA